MTPTTEHGQTCKHGHLARSCEMCELEQRCTALEAERASFEGVLMEERRLSGEECQHLRDRLSIAAAALEKIEDLLDRDALMLISESRDAFNLAAKTVAALAQIAGKESQPRQ